MTVSENSKYYIWFKLALSIVKIFICVFVIVIYEINTDKPLYIFVVLLITTESVDFLCFFYYLVTENNNRTEAVRNTVNLVKNCGSLLYLVAHILGNIWYYTCDTCYDDAPELTVLSLVLIILGYINFCVPCILCCCLCVSLPLLIFAIAYSQGAGQSPASEEIINKLDVRKWNQPNINECLICFQNYNSDDEVVILPCDDKHLFHADCLKRWLRINNSCPICRKSIQ